MKNFHYDYLEKEREKDKMLTNLFRFNLFLITTMITNQYALSRFNHRFDHPHAATVTSSKSMANQDAIILGELR